MNTNNFIFSDLSYNNNKKPLKILNNAPQASEAPKFTGALGPHAMVLQIVKKIPNFENKIHKLLHKLIGTLWYLRIGLE